MKATEIIDHLKGVRESMIPQCEAKLAHILDTVVKKDHLTENNWHDYLCRKIGGDKQLFGYGGYICEIQKKNGSIGVLVCYGEFYQHNTVQELELPLLFGVLSYDIEENRK